MNMVRTHLAIPALLTLTLSLGASCSKNKPEGTTPPGEGQAADDGGKGKAKGKAKGRKGKKGDGEQAAAQTKDPAKDCPGKVSETPTPLFPHPESGDPTAFIRVPQGMSKDDLVEQNPFFFQTMSKEGYVSTCDAIVSFMAAGMVDDDPKKEMKDVVTEFLKGFGYEVKGFENPTIEGRKLVGAVNVKSQMAGDAKLWISFENKYNAGKLFFVILESHPNAFAAIEPTFKAVTDSLIVVPPETGN